MRQTLEALDRKILTLKRMFHSCCKLKAEPGVGETITLVTEHLAKKTSRRFIRLDTQVYTLATELLKLNCFSYLVAT